MSTPLAVRPLYHFTCKDGLLLPWSHDQSVGVCGYRGEWPEGPVPSS
jgi:hypothetical protein